MFWDKHIFSNSKPETGSWLYFPLLTRRRRTIFIFIPAHLHIWYEEVVCKKKKYDHKNKEAISCCPQYYIKWTVSSILPSESFDFQTYRLNSIGGNDANGTQDYIAIKPIRTKFPSVLPLSIRVHLLNLEFNIYIYSNSQIVKFPNFYHFLTLTFILVCV